MAFKDRAPYLSDARTHGLSFDPPFDLVTTQCELNKEIIPSTRDFSSESVTGYFAANQKSLGGADLATTLQR